MCVCVCVYHVCHGMLAECSVSDPPLQRFFAPTADPASTLWVLVCSPNASFLLCITDSPCSFSWHLYMKRCCCQFLSDLLVELSFLQPQWCLCCLWEILFWWSPQILNMFWFISLTAPHYLPLALPSMEFIRPPALLLWELIFPNMTETDMQLTPGRLGYKPGLSYMTTFILHHYPSPLAVWWGPLFSVESYLLWVPMFIW